MRRMHKLTKKFIDSLPPAPADGASKEVEYSDQEIAGLRLQVNRLGRKSFLWRYQTPLGRKRALKVGNYPETSIDAARAQVIEWRAMLAKGIDPQEQQADQHRSGLTYPQFFENYLWPHVVATKRSHRVDRSRAIHHILPFTGNRPMEAITTLEWQRFHNEKKLQLSPATANRIMENVKRAYSLAIEWGLLPLTANHPKPIKLFQENNIRTRYLSLEELGRFMKALDQSPNQLMADYFRLLLATGCRKNEILQLRHEHVNLEHRVITIPQPKSGRARHVFLNDQAYEVLCRRKPVPGNPFVFPGRKPGTPIFNPKRAWLAVLTQAGIDANSVTLHTLRHTFASLLVNQGASLHEVANLLGHLGGGTEMTKRYAHLGEFRLRQTSGEMARLMSQAKQVVADTSMAEMH